MPVLLHTQQMLVAADDVIRLRGCRAFEDAIVWRVSRDDMERFGRLHMLGKTCDLPLRLPNFLLRPAELVAAQHLCHFRHDGIGNGEPKASRLRQSQKPLWRPAKF
jgi:hypothetical protein